MSTPDEFQIGEQELLAEAAKSLRSWTSGDLRHDDLTTPIRFAAAPDGRLIAAVTAGMLSAMDCALALPDEHAPSMELTVTLEEFEAVGGAESHSDRWKIYHGAPPNPRWAMIELDAARFQGHIIDGAALQVPNPLAASEPRLCGLLNREHLEGVKGAMARVLEVNAEDPRVVGVDPLGLDIRNRFDVVRLPFATPMTDPCTAESAILHHVSHA